MMEFNMRFYRHTIVACCAHLLAGIVSIGCKQVPPLAPKVMINFSQSDAGAPLARVSFVSDTYFGESIQDPYRWMEKQSPEYDAWLQAQSKFAYSSLNALNVRSDIYRKIARLSEAIQTASEVRLTHSTAFILQVAAGIKGNRLSVADMATGSTRVIVDPSQITHGAGTATIDYFEPSPNGDFVICGISMGGSEASVIYIVETSTGRVLPERIVNVQYAMPSWSPSGGSFVYSQHTVDGEGKAVYRNMRVRHHRIGTAVEQDMEVFSANAFGLGHEADLPTVTFSTTGDFIVGALVHGSSVSERILFVKMAGAIDDANTTWRRLVDIEDGIIDFVVAKDAVYGLSTKAQNRSIIRLDLKNGNGLKSVIVPDGDAPIVHFGVAADGIYIVRLGSSHDRLVRVSFDGTKSLEIQLPHEGAIEVIDASPAEIGVSARLSSWIQPDRWLHYNGSAVSDITFANSESHAIAHGIVASYVSVRGNDDTMIPLTILTTEGRSRDGNIPTLLFGYGAYGKPYQAEYSAEYIAWLEHGGMVAIAHVRGGGELGETWHRAGMRDKKQNSVDDFISCAKYLIHERYTVPGKLAAVGASAGGVVISNAIVQHPELFAVGMIDVPFVNPLRLNELASGPANFREFGTVTTKEGFESLRGMDAYNRVKIGVPYPAVLLSGGANDSRIPSWQPAKFAARLQAATSSARPVLLRIDFDGGHSFSKTWEQKAQLSADQLAFALSQMGEVRDEHRSR